MNIKFNTVIFYNEVLLKVKTENVKTMIRTHANQTLIELENEVKSKLLDVIKQVHKHLEPHKEIEKAKITEMKFI